MSDTMLLGVLNMPPDCWTGDPMDQSQRHAYYKEAAERIYKDGLRIAKLEEVAGAALGALNAGIPISPRSMIHDDLKSLMETCHD